MISEKRIKELMIESLEMVKNYDAAYRNLKINDCTILIGDESELESILKKKLRKKSAKSTRWI